MKGTTHLWDSDGKMWCHPDSTVLRRLPRKRGSNVTIMGALTSDGEVYTKVVNKTSKEIVQAFF